MQRKQLVLMMLTTFVTFSQTNHCGPHEVPGPSCGSPCPPTCIKRQPEACTHVCIVNGCVCAPGYIREKSRGSPCIRESDCPNPCENEEPGKCGLNEVYTKCNYTTCVAACNRLGPVNCPLEGTSCKSGCLCAEGHVRLNYKNPKSRCIPIKNCPCKRKRCLHRKIVV